MSEAISNKKSHKPGVRIYLSKNDHKWWL